MFAIKHLYRTSQTHRPRSQYGWVALAAVAIILFASCAAKENATENMKNVKPTLRIQIVNELRGCETPTFHLYATGEVISNGREYTSLAEAFNNRAHGKCMYVDIPFPHEISLPELAAVCNRLEREAVLEEDCTVFIQLESSTK